MKHSVKVTLILILLFIAAQVFGLYTVNKYMEVSKDDSGNTIILYANTTVGEVPKLEENQKSYVFLPIMFMIIAMSIILLLIIKFNVGRFWKYGFFFAVAVALSIAFGIYVNYYIAFIAAFILALWKVFKPNPYIHNLTEVLMYAGIAVMIVPILNIISAIGLLIFISIYDAYAVWKSKHMVTLAKFQSQSKAFAGIVIPYGGKPEEVKVAKTSATPGKHVKAKKEEKKKEAKEEKKQTLTHGKPHEKEAAYENIEAQGEGLKSAILGGGDIGFTLIFCSVVMEFLIISMGVTKSLAFFYALIPAACATIALTFLFIFSKRGKFYPAMPPISVGCFIGFGIVLLLV